MAIKLSDHFTYKKLIKFVLPSIFMMILSSVYGVIDGFIVSDNVTVTEEYTVDTQFAYSDHNPVIMKFELK